MNFHLLEINYLAPDIHSVLIKVGLLSKIRNNKKIPVFKNSFSLISFWSHANLKVEIVYGEALYLDFDLFLNFST